MWLNNTIHEYADARRIAKRRLPWMVFDYMDGAAGQSAGEQRNLDALRDMCLVPRSLIDVEHRDLSVSIFGKQAKLPFGISPMGMCNLARPGTDRAFAAHAAKHNVPVGVSTAASSSLEQMAQWSDGRAWFQLYYSGGDASTFALVDRAAAAGYEVLVLTVDVPEVGYRPRELRRGFKAPFRIGPSQFIDFAMHPRWSIETLIKGKPELANFTDVEGGFDRTQSRAKADWDFMKRVRERWKGKLVIKGVLNPDDAKTMKKLGVDAVQVSSHGGRQLESAPAPISVLPLMRKAVGKDFTLIFDSGIRSGEDIIKAYAFGANYVLVGRAFLFAAAARGERGIAEISNSLETQASVALAQIGLTNIGDVDQSVIWQER